MNNIQKYNYILNRENYLKLEYLITGGAKVSNRFSCFPKNNYNTICKEDGNGKYTTKNTCMNDCEAKYIDYHLTKANIKSETIKFYVFIETLIKKENMKVYLKGGNVIGLYILKLIYNKYKNNYNQFKNAFREFLKLDLIKDWDFVAYTKKTTSGNHQEITKTYHKKLDKLANKNKLVPRAKTFILYQTRNPIRINDKAFLEIAILDTDKLSTLELPMTTMKVQVDINNLKYIYMFAKSFLVYARNNENFDFDLIKKMISKINIIIHPHKKGLYNPNNKLDTGGLSDDLMEFIKEFAKDDKTIIQFLVIHLQDPFRLLYRLPEKNIPKTNKIKNFINKELSIPNMSWLMNTNKITNIVNNFTKELGKKILNIYNNGSISDVSDFMKGVKFDRTRIEYKNFSDDNKKLLRYMLEPVINKLISDNIQQQSADKNDIITFIDFYKKQ